jgi:hypothetical protein
MAENSAMRSSLCSHAWRLLTALQLILGAIAAPAAVAAAGVEISSDASAVQFINEQIRAAWRDAKVSPSSMATDGEWCRRLYLDVIGRIPTLDETTQFLEDRGKNKRAKLVDRLLSDAYQAEYARNWSGVWTNLLIGRGGDADRRGLVSRDGLRVYLREAFERNVPYTQLVQDLIGANGANAPGEQGFHGAVNFLLANLQDNATPATAKTARIFLGVQVQCTQCHDHPFNEWKQEQFWGLNAFFRQARPLRTFEGTRVVGARLEDEDFPGESGNPQTGEIYFERRDGTLAAMLEPTFLDGSKINPSGYVEDVNRRDELARLVTHAPEMPLAIVNRMWGWFFGHGFTTPIDDMGPHNPPTHPALLEGLANRFATSGYDLKRLIRWMVLSEPYGLSSRPGRQNSKDDPAQGGSPLFSRFYLRQIRPEQLYDSLITATKVQPEDARAAERQKQQWLAQFTITYGTDENDETSTFNGTIPQSLLLMNGELTRWATSTERETFLGQLAHEAADDRTKINKLYLAALSRLPSREELTVAQQIWLHHGGDTSAALQDIWWALLNSNEFILNH